jgi:hypothetical protein
MASAMSEYTARLTPGTPHPVTISTATKVALLAFSATAGERISVNLSVGPIGVFKIFDPNGAEVVTSATTLATVFIDTISLNTTGTYTAMVDPSNANTGSITVTLYKVPPDVAGPIVADGTGVSGTVTTPGQNVRLTFSGTTGQRVGAKATVTSGSFGCVWYLKVLKADGTSLGSVNSCGPTPFLDPVVLPENATYTLLVDPNATSTGTITLNLYTVVDLTDTIAANGAAYSATVTTPGQNVRLAFTGTAGQRVSAKGVVTAGSWGCVWWLRVLKADGTAVGSVSSCGAAFLEPVVLPENGTYTLLGDPEAASTGTATLNLYTVVDVTGSLTIGDAPQTVTLNTPGQIASFTFSGTASQVTVRLTSNSVGITTVKLLKPDGTQLTASTSASSSFNLAQQTLPTTGTYTVVIDPSSTNTGAIAVQVTNP